MGITVDAFTRQELLDTLYAQVSGGEAGAVVGNHNLHSLYLFHNDPELRAFYDSVLYTHVDGMALVAIGRHLGAKLERQHRHTYIDWLSTFLATAAEEGWRVFFVGGSASTVGTVHAALAREFPGLIFATHQGYDVLRKDSTAWQELSDFKPDVVLAGMGMPRQERWIAEARKRGILPRLFLPCGAAVEYIAGIQDEPPRWIGQLGFEWLYRLAGNPRKFYFRYLVEPLMLLPAFLRARKSR